MRKSDVYPVHWLLIGVTSFGPATCANTDYPGIYTNVLHYIDWINAKIKL